LPLLKIDQLPPAPLPDSTSKSWMGEGTVSSWGGAVLEVLGGGGRDGLHRRHASSAAR
jgi:hypothetical protein